MECKLAYDNDTGNGPNQFARLRSEPIVHAQVSFYGSAVYALRTMGRGHNPVVVY